MLLRDLMRDYAQTTRVKRTNKFPCPCSRRGSSSLWLALVSPGAQIDRQGAQRDRGAGRRRAPGHSGEASRDSRGARTRGWSTKTLGFRQEPRAGLTHSPLSGHRGLGWSQVRVPSREGSAGRLGEPRTGSGIFSPYPPSWVGRAVWVSEIALRRAAWAAGHGGAHGSGDVGGASGGPGVVDARGLSAWTSGGWKRS